MENQEQIYREAPAMPPYSVERLEGAKEFAEHLFVKGYSPYGAVEFLQRDFPEFNPTFDPRGAITLEVEDEDGYHIKYLRLRPVVSMSVEEF